MAELRPLPLNPAPDSLGSIRRGWNLLRLFLVVGLPSFWAGAIALSQLQPKLFLRLTREDGAIEVLQILLLVATAAVTAAIARRLFQRNEKRWGMIYAGIALGVFFIAAEEMSWGQRIREVAPSEFFSRYHKQGETNLHHLKLIMPLAPHLTSIVLIILIVLSTRSRGSQGQARLRGSALLWMPPVVLLPAWLCYASYRAFRTVRSLADIRSTLVL